MNRIDLLIYICGEQRGMGNMKNDGMDKIIIDNILNNANLPSMTEKENDELFDKIDAFSFFFFSSAKMKMIGNKEFKMRKKKINKIFKVVK